MGSPLAYTMLRRGTGRVSTARAKSLTAHSDATSAVGLLTQRTAPTSSGDFSPGWDLESALERVSRQVRVGDEVPRDVPKADTGKETPADRVPLRPRRILAVIIWVVLALITSLSAYFVTAMQPPVFGARIEIVYGLRLPDSFVEERQLSTQMALIRSRAVLDAVVRDVGNGSVEELESSLTVDLVPRSAFLQVTVADPDPQRAQALVRAVVTQYTLIVGGRNARDEETWLNQLADAQEAVSQRLEELERQRQQWELSGQPPPTPEEETRLMAEEADLRVRLVELRARVDDSQAVGAESEVLRVLTEPYLLPRPLSPTSGQALTAGALAGIAVATLGLGALWAARTREMSQGEAR